MVEEIFLGVYREQVYSPGKVGDDAAVLDAVLSELSGGGERTLAVQGEKIDRVSWRPACVLSMAQSPKALEILDAWHRCGTKVINSVSSVRNCYRKALMDILSAHGIPIPPGKIVRVGEEEDFPEFSPSRHFWLKRGDFHAVEPGDVIRVGSREALGKALLHFRRRNIGEILLQEHVEGETVKFYGAGPGAYFSAYRVSTGKPASSILTSLSRVAERSAEALGLEIYGGDAIVTGGDRIFLIDLNDWPSFSSCRNEAAKGIARHIRAETGGGNRG